MDDFLHNLRSGKLKQPDRPNRPYSDQQYKGGPRRNMNIMDRRKRENDTRESYERLNAIKDLLESLTKSQKRLAEAYEARISVETRKAQALEILATNIYRMLNPNAADAEGLFDTVVSVAPSDPQPAETIVDNDSAESFATLAPFEAEPIFEDEEPEEIEVEAAAKSMMTEKSDESVRDSKRLSETDRQTIVAQIKQMRDNGDNWEQIARQIADQGYPTLSGKGSWRGIMAKNLYEKSSS
jgi:hypothetical protein